MKIFIGNLTVRILGNDAADAIQRLINPGIPGTVAEIISMGVHPEYDHPPVASTTASGGPPPEDEDGIPEPTPVENVVPEGEDNLEPGPLPLPDDFPYVGTLRREGETLDSVVLKAQYGKLTEVNGIGTTGANKIQAYLVKTGRLPAAQAVKEDDPADPTPSIPGPSVEKSVTPSEPPAPLEAQGSPETSSPAGKPKGGPDASEVRQALAEVARVHKLPALKNLLAQFGATGLGDLAEENYPEALAAARRILNG